jgi:hypothetical protein
MSYIHVKVAYILRFADKQEEQNLAKVEKQKRM